MLKPLLLWSSVTFLMCMAHVTFTNLKCTALNESLTEIKQCRIKAFNRTHKYIMFHSNLKVKPINNITVNFKIMRYDHGYKPFFVDITLDGCKFMKNQKNLIAKMLFDTIKHKTNLNHTCPFDVNFKIMRYDHGYKPFYVDITIDGCKFMKNQKNLMAKMLFDIVKHYTNMNHTCPYDCMAHVTFTNLKCNMKNKTLGEYQHCYIKAVNRTHKYVTIHGSSSVKNVNNITMNIKVMRYDHGYKPFFFNLTFDACKFLKNQKNEFINLFYNPLRKISNLNHTCPYNEGVIVEKLWSGNLEHNFLKYLPIPSGDYAILSTIYFYNYEFTSIHIYMKLTT
ncbi:hypothetical protein ACLKA7_017568 [Drosophila subpalustris]